jgi:hypothetical protein
MIKKKFSPSILSYNHHCKAQDRHADAQDKKDNNMMMMIMEQNQMMLEIINKANEI